MKLQRYVITWLSTWTTLSILGGDGSLEATDDVGIDMEENVGVAILQPINNRGGENFVGGGWRSGGVWEDGREI